MPLLRLLSIALCVCVGLNKLKASALLLKTSTTQHACICNTNHPQLVIFECPDRTSQIIGFLYLQDSSFSVDLSPSHCKAIAPSVISPEGWFPVIHDRKVRRWWFCLWNFLLQWTNQIRIVICKWLSIKKRWSDLMKVSCTCNRKHHSQFLCDKCPKASNEYLVILIWDVFIVSVYYKW